jgi:hypothetical protein
MEPHKDVENQITQLEAQIKPLFASHQFEELIAIYHRLEPLYAQLHFEYELQKTKSEILKIEKIMNFEKKRDKATPQRSPQPKPVLEKIPKKETPHEILEPEGKRTVSRPQIPIQPIQRIEDQLEIQTKLEKAKQERMQVFQARKEKKVGSDEPPIDARVQEQESIKKKLPEMHSIETEPKANIPQVDQLGRTQKFSKEKETLLLEEAESRLNAAKKASDRKDFDEAARSYEKAANIFKDLGWNQQADTLFEEVKLVHLMKEKQEKEKLEAEDRQKRQAQEFENRAQKLLEEQEQQKQKIEEAKKKVSPEIQLKIETADYVLEKAKELESKEKWDKAAGRYIYLLELYKELAYPPEKCKPIEEKITKLKAKLPPGFEVA